MARNVERDERERQKREDRIIKVGFELFSKEGIENVSLQRISELAEIGPATMYNYYQNKTNLIVAISTHMWKKVWLDYLDKNGSEKMKTNTAYENVEDYLNEMIRIYREEPEILKFSSDYKTYMCRNRENNNEVDDFLYTLHPINDMFHYAYEKAKDDKSIRTDISENELFTTFTITMLGMAERYAQGLVWAMKADSDYTNELIYLKEMILNWIKG